MTRAIFVRHGQSQANLDNVFAGIYDTPLTAIGREQAARTAAFLKDYPIERVYSSHLRRARDTAEPIARTHGLDVICDASLREINGGMWEGVHFDDIDRLYVEARDTWIVDIANSRCTGGESVREVFARISASVERIIGQNEGGCVCIVSHGTPLRVLKAAWSGLGLEALGEIDWAGNASVTVVDYASDGSCSIVLDNETAHLAGIATGLPPNA